MEPKKDEAYFKKSIETAKKNALPFQPIVSKEKELEKFTKYFKDRESPENAENENKNNRLRGRKKNTPKGNDNKKYKEIPIVAHESEKPSAVTEELDAGKIYPSLYNSNLDNKKLDKKKINKKYQEIPIIPHESEKPTKVTEELNAGKYSNKVQTSLTGHIEYSKNKNKIKCDKKKLNNSKYPEIPIVAHNTEKPSMTSEEISAGKIYSQILASTESKGASNKLRGCKKNLNNKKYKEIPIVLHESQKPSLIVEELNAGKCKSTIPVTTYTGENLQKIKKGVKKAQCGKKKILNSKYKDIPIVAHDSEGPSIVFEELNSGRICTNIRTSNTNYKDENIQKNKLRGGKRNLISGKYKDIPIVAHETEKPSMVFEELNTGRTCSNVKTSVTNYKEENIQKNKLRGGKRNLISGKYKDIPIVAHESLKPSLVFEEINAGKASSNIMTSVTNYKEENIQKSNLRGGKRNVKSGKYKDIPIVAHDSQLPSAAFEEINAGNMFKPFQTSKTNYKETKRPKEAKCGKKSNIIIHESEPPSCVFEQINAGKYYSNIQTSVTDKRLKYLSKFKPVPIVAHESEKPSVAFEEANTGILLSFQHNI